MGDGLFGRPSRCVRQTAQRSASKALRREEPLQAQPIARLLASAAAASARERRKASHATAMRRFAMRARHCRARFRAVKLRLLKHTPHAAMAPSFSRRQTQHTHGESSP